MTKLGTSVAFRLALGYGLLSVGSMAVVAAIFYYGTVVVLNHQIDRNLVARSHRLRDRFETRGLAWLQQAIQQLLDDGLESDTEVYGLVDPEGHTLVGNLAGWTARMSPLGRLTTQRVGLDHMKVYTCGKKFLPTFSNRSMPVKSMAKANHSPKYGECLSL